MKKGFTLIELLVVISIISLLSSVVLSSLNSARLGAKDAARIRGINEIHRALMIYDQKNGQLPFEDDAKTNGFGWVYAYINNSASGVPQVSWSDFMNEIGMNEYKFPELPDPSATKGGIFVTDEGELNLYVQLETDHKLTCKNRGGWWHIPSFYPDFGRVEGQQCLGGPDSPTAVYSPPRESEFNKSILESQNYMYIVSPKGKF